MGFNLNACREQLNSTDHEAVMALRKAVDAIPHSVPILPALYAKHRSTSSPALQSWTFASIGRFEELAIQFILTLLESDDSRSRCDAINLLVASYRPSVRIVYPLLPARPANSPAWGEHFSTVVTKLKSAVLDPIREVRTLATTALDDIGEAPQEIVDILIDSLSSDDLVTCYNAACYLGRLEANAINALPALRKLIKNGAGKDGPVIRPVLAAQIAVRRIEGTEQ
jgi:hypothetical protein